MDIASLIVSIIAVLISAFGIYGYFKHDRKLKELELREYENTEKERKQAKIFVDTRKLDFKGNHMFTIKNRGLCEARNLRWHFIDDVRNLTHIEDGDIELLSPDQESRTKYQIIGNQKRLVKVEFFWEDDYSKDNHSNQIVNICNE